MNQLQFFGICLAGWINRNQQNLGHEIGLGTIAKILRESGVDPAPDRQKKTTWKEFLRIHWDVLAAADFFSVEVWTALGLVRYHVFFVIRLVTWEVHIAGIVPDFPEFIARVASGALSEVGLKRHYKTPEPIKLLRAAPKR